MALRMTRRILAPSSKLSLSQGWTPRDPHDRNGPAPIGLGWIRKNAEHIVKMADEALKSGDNGEQLRALAESNRLAYKIRVEAHRSFSAASGGIAHLEDYP